MAGPLAFATGWAWPGLFNLAVVRVNPSAPGAATGITQTGTYLGAVVGPVLFGVVAEHALVPGRRGWAPRRMALLAAMTIVGRPAPGAGLAGRTGDRAPAVAVHRAWTAGRTSPHRGAQVIRPDYGVRGPEAADNRRHAHGGRTGTRADRLMRTTRTSGASRLIELLVVVLVIAILMAVAIPTFLGGRQTAGDRATQGNVRNAFSAARIYYNERFQYSADPAEMVAVEPSLTWTTTPLDGAVERAVGLRRHVRLAGVGADGRRGRAHEAGTLLLPEGRHGRRGGGHVLRPQGPRVGRLPGARPRRPRLVRRLVVELSSMSRLGSPSDYVRMAIKLRPHRDDQ